MSNERYVEKEYYDSLSGEVIRVQRQICARCHNEIPLSGMGHNACRQAFLEEEAAHNEEIRKQQCLAQFGAVLSRQEQLWRTYPDSKMAGYNETYNQHKKRIEAERRQGYFDRCAARIARKERELPETRSRLKYLEAQVKIDEREQVEDDANEESRLKEQTQR